MGTDTVTQADPPAGAGLETRVGAIEAEQRAQRGILEQIRDRLGAGGGTGSAAAPAGGASATPAADAATIAEQVRAEIAAADQRRQAEQAETRWKDDVNTTLDKIKRERQPREPETGVRARVQRILIGRPR